MLRSIPTGIFLALALANSSVTAAQSTAAYPAKPIRWIVPFASGSSDVLARILATKATESLGQPFIIDSRPGAGGNIGSAMAANAPGDGYTILLGTIATHGVNPSLFRSMPYDAEKDFAPVTLLAFAPNVLIVNPSLPIRSAKEFVEYVRKNPGTNYGSAGPGTSMHMAGELYQIMTKSKMTHVAYKGASEALLSVARGDVQVMFSNLPPALGLIKEGRVRALAVTTASRVSWLPQLPTIAEEGLPGYDVSVWFGAFAPANTSATVVERLSKELRHAAADAATRDKLESQGYVVKTMESREFAGFVKNEIARWGKIVKETGARID